MSKAPVQIHFITWPDGKLFEGTQTSVSDRLAIAKAVQTWLIPQFFPGLDLLGLFSLRTELWAAMERAGFKLHCIDVPEETEEGISR